MDPTIRTAERLSERPAIACQADNGFQQWLAQAGGSIALTTYQAGKVALIGWDGAQLTLLMRQFDKPLGLAVEGSRLALATRTDVVILANAPLLAGDYLESQPGRYDALYLPRVTFHTGDVGTHDVVFHQGSVTIVNTKFSCLARLSWEHSFEPIWKPPFITDIVPEDRCHLNGVAVVEGQLRFATAHAATDSPAGWRKCRTNGGVLIEIPTGEIVLRGLCMPHSPRWHDGRLWLLNSGAGELLVWQPGSSRTDVVCRLPGYLRGLCLVGGYALVGLSKIREKYLFGGVPVEQYFPQLACGVCIVDLSRGEPVGWFEFTAGCTELYEVQFLPGIRRPMILNLEKPASREAFALPQCSFWIRSSVGRESSWPASPIAGDGACNNSGGTSLGSSACLQAYSEAQQ